MAVDVL